MDRVLIVPFPIHHPDRWPHYVPPDTAMFVVVYSPWERKKVERMKQAGFTVVVEDSLNKGMSGKEVRRLMATGGNWQHLVPPAVARVLSKKGNVGRF